MAFVLGLAAGAAAQGEMRALRPVPTPAPEAAEASFVPVDPRKVEKAVQELFSAWNTPRMLEYLGEDFYEAYRLNDTLATEIPRDAVLRVLGIESISTLSQKSEPGLYGRPPVLVSIVAVIVRSQLEFNDPAEGFVRREGVNEYVFEVREARPR